MMEGSVATKWRPEAAPGARITTAGVRFWDTPGHVETLRIEWQAGASGQQIADMLGCTRCSVMGKIHRLGLVSPNSFVPVSWTPAMVTHLRELVTGGTSWSNIGAVLCVKGWEVRRKARTLRLDKPRKYKATVRTQRAKQGRVGPWLPIDKRPAPAPYRAPRVVDNEIPIAQRVQLADLKPWHCRFIVGDPREEHFYCGALPLIESSYCSAHYARCYRSAQADYSTFEAA